MKTTQQSKQRSVFDKLNNLFTHFVAPIKIESNGTADKNSTPAETTSSTLDRKKSGKNNTNKGVASLTLDVLPRFVETGVIEYDSELDIYHCGIYAFTSSEKYRQLHNDGTRIQVLRYNLNTNPKNRHRYPLFAKMSVIHNDYVVNDCYNEIKPEDKALDDTMN